MAIPRTALSNRREPRKLDLAGLEVTVLIPGAFYQCVQPGGFSDALTGIHIPGPKAILDGSTRREVVSLTDLPDPIQVPHLKAVIEVSDSGKQRKEIEVDFNADDEQPIHEAFQLALSTGILRMVPDEIVEEKYPNAWAKREEKIVWRTDGVKKAKPIDELFAEAERDNRLQHLAAGAQAAVQDREAEKDAPARPPTPPKPPRP